MTNNTKRLLFGLTVIFVTLLIVFVGSGMVTFIQYLGVCGITALAVLLSITIEEVSQKLFP